MSLLTAAGLNKRYRVGAEIIHVLRDLDLEVAAGEMVAVVGASGVGKSTLLHLLGGLDRADTGSIRIGGTAVSGLADADLVAFRNRHVGFVFQFHHLLPEFDALENAEMPLRIARLAAREATPRARRLLERVGLGDRLRHRPSMLSGGEQQRVAVARALINRPRVVLADEPTGSLHWSQGEKIMTLLHGLNEAGTTIIQVSHDERVAAFGRRVIELADGWISGDRR